MNQNKEDADEARVALREAATVAVATSRSPMQTNPRDNVRFRDNVGVCRTKKRDLELHWG